MLNQYTDGKTLLYTNRLDDAIPGGSLVVSGDVCGVSFEDILPGETGALLLSGVYKFNLPSPTGTAMGQGTRVFVAEGTVFTEGDALTFESDGTVPVGVLARPYSGSGVAIYLQLVPFARVGMKDISFDSELNLDSENAVQNKAVTKAVRDIGFPPSITVTDDTTVVPNTHTIYIKAANADSTVVLKDGDTGPKGPKGDKDTFTDIVTSTEQTFTVSPGAAVVWTPDGDGTLNISGGVAGSKAFACIDIVLGADNAVTLGTGLSWASPDDALKSMVKNHCVVMFDGTSAVIAVCDNTGNTPAPPMVIDDTLDPDSPNPVKNSTLYNALAGKATAPIVATVPPTSATEGAVGQLYVDTATSKTYHCTAVTVDDTDPENPVTTYTWTDDINAKGGIIRNGTLSVWNGASGWTRLGYGTIDLTGSNNITAIQYGTIFLGLNCSTNYVGCAVFAGVGLKGNDMGQCLFAGQWNENKPNSGIKICVGNGTSNTSRSNALEAYSNGDLYIAGGHQQGITEIPATTSAYTLAEGCFVHAPETAPAYTLPAVTDSTRTHRIDLTVYFTTVQTFSFVDSGGTAIAPLFAPTIAAGDVFTFICEWSSLRSRWLVYPRNNNGKVSRAELPVATQNEVGAVKVWTTNADYNDCGVWIANGLLRTTKASNAQVGSRTTDKPITPTNLNYAVTAALTDPNHLTLSTAQQAVAQQVLGISGGGGCTDENAVKEISLIYG